MTQGRSPDSQVIANRRPSHFRRNSGYNLPVRSLLTVARPCGIHTRFPFHPPPKGREPWNSLWVPYRRLRRSTKFCLQATRTSSRFDRFSRRARGTLAERGGPDPCKLLVVDDNPENRDLLLRSLTGRGYQVEVAENGAEALDKDQPGALRSGPAGSSDAGDERARPAPLAARHAFAQRTARHHGERG